MIQLVITDYDRTLTDPSRGLYPDPEIMLELERMRRSGIKLGIVSGQSYSYMLQLRNRYPNSMDGFVAENGCLGFHAGRKYLLCPNPELGEIRSWLRSAGIPHAAGEIMISVGIEYLGELRKIISRFPETYLELNVDSVMILPRGASKSSGVRWLQGKLGANRESTMCIGDGENDISMRECCCILGAPANAVDELKRIADYVSDLEYSRGTLEIMRRFLKW